MFDSDTDRHKQTNRHRQTDRQPDRQKINSHVLSISETKNDIKTCVRTTMQSSTKANFNIGAVSTEVPVKILRYPWHKRGKNIIVVHLMDVESSKLHG